MGKRLEDHLRFAVAYWHTFAWPGGDPFGGQTFERPWFGDTMEQAKLKADVAFEMFSLLGVPYLLLPRCRRAARRARPSPRARTNLDEIVDYLRGQAEGDRRQAAVGHGQPVLASPLHGGRRDQSRSGRVRLCGGDGEDLHGRDASSSAARTTCCGAAARATRRCSTPISSASCDQVGRFLNLVVEYKHKIGFKGTILIEPKPQEPTKHQYDYDVATVYGFLQAATASRTR